jgi:HEAT repeat protein
VRFAFARAFGQTPPAMSSHALADGVRRRTRVTLLVLAIAGLPSSVLAQLPIDGAAPRGRLRDAAKNPQASQKLDDNIRKLSAEDLPTRLEGVRGLGEVNDPKATELLIAAANDPDMAVRVKAIDTLGLIRAKDATPLLIQQLFMRDNDASTKRRILACLGKIGDTRATKPILDLLARDNEPGLRGNAIFALGDIGDRTALPALEKVSSSEQDPNLRGLAQEAMRKIRERPEPAVVVPALAADRRPPGAPPTP